MKNVRWTFFDENGFITEIEVRSAEETKQILTKNTFCWPKGSWEKYTKNEYYKNVVELYGTDEGVGKKEIPTFHP
jgi:hypothetical protein